jgi:hypothetical protein
MHTENEMRSYEQLQILKRIISTQMTQISKLA